MWSGEDSIISLSIYSHADEIHNFHKSMDLLISSILNNFFTPSCVNRMTVAVKYFHYQNLVSLTSTSTCFPTSDLLTSLVSSTLSLCSLHSISLPLSTCPVSHHPLDVALTESQIIQLSRFPVTQGSRVRSPRTSNLNSSLRLE